MSTNTTNTNDGNGSSNGASGPKSRASKSASTEGKRHYPFGAFPLPDPATLERLANEFFLAMPKDLGNGHGVEESTPLQEAESEEIPTEMFTEEMLPLRRSPGFESAPSIPASPPYSHPGPQ